MPPDMAAFLMYSVFGRYIMIHQYKLLGLNVVLDVASGSVHAVDDVAYDMIEIFESGDRAEVISSIEERYLNKDGITREDIAE